ncbi:hypothetical protein [Streptomyces sp. NPDC088707]|uniref:hypothetical protein n=1 Tax=Streptomyces sp. NPDC088707 TaxID=3365871 RepID=UPI003815C442
MTITTRSTPTPRPAVFPPPSTPLLFADGDRYEWPETGAAWTRVDGGWRPTPDDGSGYLTDVEVRSFLHRAVVHWDVRHRFVPVAPGEILPGAALHGRLDLGHLPVGDFQSFAQYVTSSRTGDLVPLRDLIAEYDEDIAYDFSRTIKFGDTAHLLGVMLTEQIRPELSYDAAAGRLYARYEKFEDGRRDAGMPPVKCLHVFVLSGAPAEA